jgi:hypothetical protein
MSKSSTADDDAEMLDLLNSLADNKPRQRNRLGPNVLSTKEIVRRSKATRHRFASLPTIDIPRLKPVPPKPAKNSTAGKEFRTGSTIKSMMLPQKRLHHNIPAPISKSTTQPVMMNIVSDGKIRRVRKKPRKTIIASVNASCFVVVSAD